MKNNQLLLSVGALLSVPGIRIHFLTEQLLQRSGIMPTFTDIKSHEGSYRPINQYRNLRIDIRQSTMTTTTITVKENDRFFLVGSLHMYSFFWCDVEFCDYNHCGGGKLPTQSVSYVGHYRTYDAKLPLL